MHETLNMLLPLAGILLGAKAAAQISHRFGLPAVFGELLLGLVLGPSLLGILSPNETLQLLADIGVILLMFIAGLETDTVAMKQAGKASPEGQGNWATSTFEDLVQYNDGFRTNLIGTPEQIAERIVAYQEVGVDLILAGFLHFQEEVEFFGKRVLPLVRQLERAGKRAA